MSRTPLLLMLLVAVLTGSLPGKQPCVRGTANFRHRNISIKGNRRTSEATTGGTPRTC